MEVPQFVTEYFLMFIGVVLGVVSLVFAVLDLD